MELDWSLLEVDWMEAPEKSIGLDWLSIWTAWIEGCGWSWRSNGLPGLQFAAFNWFKHLVT